MSEDANQTRRRNAKEPRTTKRQRQKIAHALNAELPGMPALTEEIVRKVETGEDFVANHPVHLRILTEINALFA